MQKLVLASNNAGKLREFQELLAPFQYEVIPQGALAIPAADEPYLTFVENALAKARHASSASGLPALADDSGICAHALNGEPGIRSARYAGINGNDAANNQKLFSALQGKADRGAHYVCALVMVESANDPEPLIVQTRWYGQVVNEAKGSYGFGYDPYFFLPELGCTAAELEPSEKNLISHRGQALRELIAQLQTRA
ncbi:MAG: non-canonical purine NTP pyrophosphatase, RdgB/HAM1 family [Polynucleobacter sp. 24-46-87]|jgi:XTP/dITP diphosphohydrolase|nr:MAG: non-canonical purine NTP pyrophosphatase, RdgB/HAM1 family [Polynucleobacter sp. 16-46-70]OZA00659.1 MAG: non-canonical purine NTP pyrophosphatase, RdgB/HAM1 family [Polynucleobacter sp. 24-46-87]OZA41257.1 MAG: non-canonical purine NTP pyrophosphatase, RdgB/HAM1 family [Polynucleobacter sp. 17-46-58]HQR83291.1 RdgB/HAM1 family non-canonical purine NTP pyrophosphatase [Polynucleobacter sp.]HQS60216.1 RdgB/HAM1 family non-canonical purine NTP pyrophosphatase [Polynucleobacter sp.]